MQMYWLSQAVAQVDHAQVEAVAQDHGEATCG